MKFRDIETSSNKNLYLIALSVVVGVIAGFLASLYRFALEKAEWIGRFSYGKVAQHPLLLFGVIPVVLGFVLIITFLMKKFPMFSGSGILQVKGQLQGAF